MAISRDFRTADRFGRLHPKGTSARYALGRHALLRKARNDIRCSIVRQLNSPTNRNLYKDKPPEGFSFGRLWYWITVLPEQEALSYQCGGSGTHMQDSGQSNAPAHIRACQIHGRNHDRTCQQQHRYLLPAVPWFLQRR